MVEMEVRKVTKGVESNMVAFDFERTPITQIADYIIITASRNNASDIHFDPRDESMMVRFRIDGDLQDYTSIPKLYERTLTTRLKLLAGMNITESRLPQDGAIKGEFGGQYLDMRVSCLPLNTGEKIVIRILDYTRSLKGVEHLGFNQTNLKKIKRMMGVPNGIILVTGATGSGKSTTVYSILQELNRPETNIITVEDPIEMNIEGMNQVQVNAEIGMTFAAALRSILRQDPNIILIGEIRDSETAQIAVRASITGHLVLSTIHTNNALSTIERLLDMDVERYLLSTSLTGIIAQRLAKKLCTHCRIERETTKYEKKVFKKFMNRDIEKIYDANPKGCENCRNGYKGRIAVHEVLEIDDEIRNALAINKMTKEELSKMVYGSKTITMLQDALGKAISGLTSFEEVYRVIEIETEPGDDTAYLTRAIEDIPETIKPTSPVQTTSKVTETSPLQVAPTTVSTIVPVTTPTTTATTTNVPITTPATVTPSKVSTPVNTNKDVNTQNTEIKTPILLTKEQELQQAENAKIKLKEQVEAENAKKLAEVISKPQEVQKTKLVVQDPKLNPVPVQTKTNTENETQNKEKTAEQPIPIPQQRLYQLPRSSNEQLPKQVKPTSPKIEKMEKAIPELNIKIKTNDKKATIKSLSGSPIFENNNVFEEKDKVKAIDLNKISQSTDLKKEEKVISPLKPTVKPDEKNDRGNNIPVIIETFSIDDSLRSAPKLNAIKLDQIKNNETVPTTSKEKITVKKETANNSTEKFEIETSTANTSKTDNKDSERKEQVGTTSIKPVVSKTTTKKITKAPVENVKPITPVTTPIATKINIETVKPTTPVVETKVVPTTKHILQQPVINTVKTVAPIVNSLTTKANIETVKPTVPTTIPAVIKTNIDVKPITPVTTPIATKVNIETVKPTTPVVEQKVVPTTKPVLQQPVINTVKTVAPIVNPLTTKANIETVKSTVHTTIPAVIKTNVDVKPTIPAVVPKVVPTTKPVLQQPVVNTVKSTVPTTIPAVIKTNVDVKPITPVTTPIATKVNIEAVKPTTTVVEQKVVPTTNIPIPSIVLETKPTTPTNTVATTTNKGKEVTPIDKVKTPIPSIITEEKISNDKKLPVINSPVNSTSQVLTEAITKKTTEIKTDDKKLESPTTKVSEKTSLITEAKVNAIKPTATPMTSSLITEVKTNNTLTPATKEIKPIVTEAKVAPNIKTEKQISDTDASKIKAILTSTEKKPFITEFKATPTTASPLKTIEKNSLITEAKTTTPLTSQSISKTPLVSQAKTSLEKKPFITEAKITPTKQVSSTTQPTKETPKPLVTETKPNTVPLTEIKIATKKSFIAEEKVVPTKQVSSTIQPTKETPKPLVTETKPNTVPLTEIKAAPKRSFITEEKVVPLKSTPTIPTVEKKELIKEVKTTTPIKQTTNTTPLLKTTPPEKKPLITETKPNVLVTPTAKPLITEEKINQVPKTTAPTLPSNEKKPLVTEIKNKEEKIEVKKDNSSINITDNKNKVNTASTTPIEIKTPAVQVPKQQENNKTAIKKEPTVMKKAEEFNSDADSDLPILGED